MPGPFSSDHSRSLSRSSQPHRHSPQAQESDSMHRQSGSYASNPNVFSDEYSLEPVNSEQTTLTPRSQSVSSIASSHTLRSNTGRYEPVASTSDKPDNDASNDLGMLDNPFGDNARVSYEGRDDSPHRSSLPQKGVDAVNSNRNSIASVNSHTPSTTQRSQSTSSRFSMPPRALSPYTGATGPSHPYAMYPQVGVSRSPSVTTTSTIRPMDRPLGDTSAPQHPYAMYSQNVVLEEGMDGLDGLDAMDTPLDTPIDSTPINPPVIPLGFPGHTQAYQRPPGRADDDVGDLIGPDGHTEQLPPYSRYPDGTGPKIEEGYESVSDPGAPREGFLNDETQHGGGGTGTGTGTGAGTGTDTGTSTGTGSGPGTVVGAGAAGGMQQVSNASSGALALAPEQQAANPRGSNEHPDQSAPVSGVMAFEEKLKSKGKKRACCGLPVWTLVLVIAAMAVAASIGGAIGGVLGARKSADDGKPKPTGPDIVTVTASPRMDATPISSVPSNLKTIPTGTFMVPADLKNQSKFCVSDPDYKVAWSCKDEGYVPIEVDGSESQHTVRFPAKPFDFSSSFNYGAQAPLLNDPKQSLSLMMDTSDLSRGPALFFYALFDKLVILPQDTFSASSASNKRGIPDSDILSNSIHRKELAQNGDKPWFCWWNSTTMEFFLYINETAKQAQFDSSTATLPPDDFVSTPTPTSYGHSSQSSNLSSYPRKIKMGERRDYPEAKAPYCQQMELLGSGQVRTYSPATIQIQEVEPTPTTTLKGDGSATQTYTAKAEYESACYCVSLTD